MFLTHRTIFTAMTVLTLAVGLFGRGVLADSIFAEADADAAVESRPALHLEDAIEQMRSAIDAMSDLTVNQKTRLKAELESGLRAEISSRSSVHGASR